MPLCSAQLCARQRKDPRRHRLDPVLSLPLEVFQSLKVHAWTRRPKAQRHTQRGREDEASGERANGTYHRSREKRMRLSGVRAGLEEGKEASDMSNMAHIGLRNPWSWQGE